MMDAQNLMINNAFHSIENSKAHEDGTHQPLQTERRLVILFSCWNNGEISADPGDRLTSTE
jgi:hypothetical protein